MMNKSMSVYNVFIISNCLHLCGSPKKTIHWWVQKPVRVLGERLLYSTSYTFFGFLKYTYWTEPVVLYTLLEEIFWLTNKITMSIVFGYWPIYKTCFTLGGRVSDPGIFVGYRYV